MHLACVTNNIVINFTSLLVFDFLHSNSICSKPVVRITCALFSYIHVVGSLLIVPHLFIAWFNVSGHDTVSSILFFDASYQWLYYRSLACYPQIIGIKFCRMAFISYTWQPQGESNASNQTKVHLMHAITSCDHGLHMNHILAIGITHLE